ncbi:MAG: DUF2442 domain-containing protein [Polyangiales bacterium]
MTAATMGAKRACRSGDAIATAVVIEEARLVVTLADGREVRVPLDWFPLLHSASAEDRANHRLTGGGRGIHWPALDEDLSIAGLLTR